MITATYRRLLSPWILAAIGAGILAGVLPVQWSLLVFGGIGLGLLCMIDVRIGVLITLVLAPLKTLIETEGHYPLPLDVGQIALILTFGTWLMRSIADRRRIEVARSAVYVPLLIFLSGAGLSAWSSLSASGTLNELIKWGQMLALCALVITLSLPPWRRGSTGSAVGWIVSAILAAAVSQAIIGIYQFNGGSGAPHLWILDFQHFRAFGGFGQPNPFGAFMGLTLPLAIGATLGAGMHTWRLWRESAARALVGSWVSLTGVYAVGAGIIGVGLIDSWSRGAWLGFAAAALTLVIFFPRRRWQGIALAAVGAAVLGFMMLTGLAPASLVARFTDFTQELTGYDDVRGQPISDANYAVLERLAHWQVALAIADDYPWLGVGFGNYEVAYPRYALMNWPLALGHAHNYYLNLLAETGVIGLSAYLVAWGSIVVLTMRALRKHTGFERGIALGLMGVWAHLAIHSVFDKLYVNNLFLHIGAMLGLIGVLLAVSAGTAKGKSEDDAGTDGTNRYITA